MKRTKYSKTHTNLPKARTGPKGFWSENILEQVFQLARFGMTDKEIAEIFMLNVNTIDNWKRTKPGFDKALQNGRLISSLAVVDSIHKSACGYTYDEEYYEYKKSPEGIEVLISRKVIKRYMPPDMKAAIYLLKARHGDKWADVHKTEFSGSLSVAVKQIDLEGLTEDEKKWLKSISLKQLASIHERRNN